MTRTVNGLKISNQRKGKSYILELCKTNPLEDYSQHFLPPTKNPHFC